MAWYHSQPKTPTFLAEPARLGLAACSRSVRTSSRCSGSARLCRSTSRRAASRRPPRGGRGGRARDRACPGRGQCRRRVRGLVGRRPLRLPPQRGRAGHPCRQRAASRRRTLAKGGRALYTEARLVSLYGSDAARGVRRRGRRPSGHAASGAQAVEAAERELRVDRSISTAVAGRPPLRCRPYPWWRHRRHDVDAAVSDLCESSCSASPAAQPRHPCRLRVLERGPNEPPEGQLLEELVESASCPGSAPARAASRLD